MTQAQIESLPGFEIRSRRLIDAAFAKHPGKDIAPCGFFPYTFGIHGELQYWYNVTLSDGRLTTGIVREEYERAGGRRQEPNTTANKRPVTGALSICPECERIKEIGKTCNCKAAEVI